MTPLFIEENHASVLRHWADFRRKLDRPAALITFDRHTDTRLPFNHFGHSDFQLHGDLERWNREIDERRQKVDFTSSESIAKAIEDLKHDQHIQAALDCGIFDQVIIFSHEKPDDPEHRPEITYVSVENDRGNGIDDLVGEEKVTFSNQLLDDYLLSALVQKTPSLQSLLDSDKNLILDVDLDYGSSSLSFRPQKRSILDRILERAAVITVATEIECARNSWIEGNSDYTKSIGYLRETLLAK